MGSVKRMIRVPPQTVVVFADIGCPWAHAALFRLHRYRDKMGLSEAVRFDVRAFPLEIFNRRPTPKLVLDAETVSVGAMEPGAGWQMWQSPPHQYPVTTLLPMEAVEAVKEQSPEASEELDRALRVAFFGESRCISVRDVILDVADPCDHVDVDRLRVALDDGRARRAVIDQKEQAEEHAKGSPHLFLADGSDFHNPGVQFHWEGPPGHGFPVVDSDDASIYEDILRRAAD